MTAAGAHDAAGPSNHQSRQRMPSRPIPRAVLVAAGLAVALLSAACASRRVSWTPVASNGRHPVEVDSSRIRPVEEGVIEVWSRELYTPVVGASMLRERRTGVYLNCETQRFRLVDVYQLGRDGTRYRDTAYSMFMWPTPERAPDRPWLEAYRLPFKADEVCARWGGEAERPGGAGHVSGVVVRNAALGHLRAEQSVLVTVTP